MPAKTKWELPCGAVIIKYRMTLSTIEYLRYEHGEPLEYGDYTAYKSLKLAKEYKAIPPIRL